MFSVIIPSYNKIDCIEKTIHSVFNQTLLDFELIIVDDGSTDGSRELLTQYQAKYKNINVVFQKNMGVSVARNNGSVLAKFDYLAFLDADDWWEATFLEEMKGLLKKCPDAGLYSSNFSLVKKSYSTESKFNIKSGYIDYFKSYVQCGFRQLINSSSIVVPKSVYFKMGGFPKEIKRGEDFYLWTKIAVNEKVAYLNKHLSNYNQDSNISNRATKKLHNPEFNYVFYFSDFREFEDTNLYLKILLDHIRVGNYFRYVNSNLFINESKLLLQDVNFDKQSLYTKILCSLPVRIARIIIYFENYSKALKRKLAKVL
jgi:glycosyltransferase involved in cell wall biosynthesis